MDTIENMNVFTNQKSVSAGNGWGKMLAVIVCFLLLAAGQMCYFQTSQVMAAKKVSSIEQLEDAFKKPIKEGKHTIQFQGPANMTTAQIQGALERAGKSQSRLFAGSFQISKRITGNDGYADYTIQLSDDAWMKVKTLKSKKAALKAAAKVLKNGKYSTNFYSEKSYYDVFRNLLQQHPEYNYGTAVWRSSNGAYGYQRSKSLTKAQQDAKMAAADQAAAQAVKKCIKSKMTDKQKAKAIHNYIAKNCVYGGNTADTFTAYGALVDHVAVCQGYAAAFNLMAGKCGLQAMTVCGTAQGGPHAWTYVKIGKKYRYIDCTWDDTDAAGKGYVYTYFLVKADKMKEGHVWKEADFPSSDIKNSKMLLSKAS